MEKCSPSAITPPVTAIRPSTIPETSLSNESMRRSRIEIGLLRRLDGGDLLGSEDWHGFAVNLALLEYSLHSHPRVRRQTRRLRRLHHQPNCLRIGHAADQCEAGDHELILAKTGVMIHEADHVCPLSIQRRRVGICAHRLNPIQYRPFRRKYARCAGAPRSEE